MKSVLRHLLRHASALFLPLALCLLGVNAHAATYTVTNLNDSVPGSLRSALAFAGAGDTVNFQPGLSGTITLTSLGPYIAPGVTVQGPGAGVIAVDGATQYRVFNFAAQNSQGPTTTISGLTLQNGSDLANLPRNGGGIYIDNGNNVALSKCVFFNNQAIADGGALFINTSASATVSNCIFKANGNTSGTLGGALWSYGTLALTNCIFVGNQGHEGGAIWNYDATMTLTGCTFTGNHAANTGGAIINYGGPVTLTNCIMYGDYASAGTSEIYASGGQVSHCDIDQTGSFTDNGNNINTDPQFVRAPFQQPYGSPIDYGDLHLKSGSPCAGAGTNNAPAYLPTDLDGVLRPNSPSIGAYEAQIATHILYTNASSGVASVVTVNTDGTQSTQNYGPYAGWAAKAIAEGRNGPVRLLWANTDGRAWLWNLNDTNPSATGFIYGPYTDNSVNNNPNNLWNATALSVGPDNAVHLLWNNTDYRVMLWTVDSGGGFTLAGYGPYTDNAPQNLWSATAVTTGPDNVTRIVWNNTDYRVMLWDVKADFTFTLAGYGPYTDDTPQHLWSAVGVSVGSDNLTHLLWSNTDRRIMFWNVNADFSFGLAGFGPYTDGAPQNLWSVAAVATGANNLSRLVWNNPDGSGMLWAVDNAFNSSSLTENPAAGFTAVSLAVGP